jgi:predicted  nucleic acid-binding Zn-ribbon protein
MKGLRKFAALFVPLTTLFLLFGLSSPAMADSTTDYNQKVAEAQAKIQDLQSQLSNAQANLDSWTNSSNSQADQLNSAQTAATEAKDALEVAVSDYNSKKADYDVAFADVQAAEAVVAQAVAEVNAAADVVDSTYDSYAVAQQNADNAQAVMNQAQIDYDTNLINVGGTGNTPGLKVDVYTGINRYGNPPQKSDTAYTKCKTTTVANIDANWGGGDILGCGSDYVMLHYKGYITYPTTTKVYFQAPADDGFYMSINGTQVINDWSLKGCGANSTGMFSFIGGKSYAIDAWFYEWTGGACSTLNYKPLNGSSYAVAPASFFTQEAVATMVKDPALLVVLNAKTALYVQAVAAEENANVVYEDACNVYDGANMAYGYAGSSLANKNAILVPLEYVMNNAESDWQNRSDDKVVADANLRDLKIEYSSTFEAIESAAQQVDDLEAKVAQAKVDLANIPKPSASDKRKPKKTTNRYFADGAYLPRQVFLIDLK